MKNNLARLVSQRNLEKHVVALYVDARGPYPGIVQEWYGTERNAKTYAGPYPVVAHPPCGPWGPMRHLSSGVGAEQDATCGPHAVEMVRRWGGVLEHPKGSKLFAYCGMPHPDDPTDEWGGYTIEVQQVDWGHPARKRTWLYIVGVELQYVPMFPPRREPTHWASGSRGRSKGKQGSPVPPGIKVCSAQQRRRTPTDFARWLVDLATGCSTLPIGTDK
jgi:hypothetical protein